jgi:hypothetical protein
VKQIGKVVRVLSVEPIESPVKTVRAKADEAKRPAPAATPAK